MGNEGLAILGLILSMLGTVLAFFFGFPQPDHSEAVTLEVEDNTVFTDGTSAKELKAKARRKKLLYKSMSYAALTLLLVGFFLQALAIKD